jgi:hypothetical protein
MMMMMMMMMMSEEQSVKCLTGESKVTRENLLLCCSAHRKFNII